MSPSLLRWSLALAAVCSSLTLGAAELRLGIVGLDTSHVGAFLHIFNDPKSPDYVPGARIVGAFKGGSPDVEASWSRVEGYTRQATGAFGVKLHDSIEELAQDVDGILILSVDGRPHLEQFRRTLAAKKPVFIDKPIAGSLSDTMEIVRLAREAGVPCFSSSSLRYTLDSPAREIAQVGQVSSVYSFGPAELEPHHPDLYWYGVHAVEALYTVLGPGCVEVVRTHTANTDVVTGVWSDGRVGIVQGNRNTYNKYGVTVVGTKGVLRGGEKHSYKPLAEAMLEFFRTGVAPVPLDTTLEIFVFMEAADESKRRGGRPVQLAEVRQNALRAGGAIPGAR